MKTLLRVLKYGHRHKWYLRAVIVSLVMLTALSLAMPMAVRGLLNIISEPSNTSLPKVAWVIGSVLITFYILRVFFLFVINYIGHKYSLGTFCDIRYDLYKHLQQVSPKFYGDKQVGQIIQRLMDDTGRLDDLLAHSFPDVIVGVLTFIGVTILLFIINPILAIVVLAPLPILLTISIFQRKMRKHYKSSKKALGEMYGMLSDNFQGMKEIQIFGKQEYEQNRIREKNDTVNKYMFKGLKWSSILKPMMEMLQGIGTVSIILVGGYLAVQSKLDVADIVAFMLYVGILYVPLQSLARAIEEGSEAIVSISRVFEYIDTESEVRDRENAITVGNLKGNLEFDNVTFRYRDTDVLKDFSFRADAGQMIALVGETGAGKTTIASLIARFYDVNDGVIKIDGMDIRDMTLQSLRNNLSIVLQDVFLFNGTIAENIAYGSSNDVTLDDIIRVSKFACIHDFVDGLANKYDTRVGERGVRLSGGQKQRLAIARALLRNTPILILDEATSSIDNLTEREIQNAIDKLSADKSKTIIVIAHRLSTIEKADKILFIENGNIIEQGSHKELLTKDGRYAKLRKGV